MRCDLHMHSTVSDGSLPVRELVRAVHAAGVQVFALTDHDSVQGFAEAHDEARTLGLTLIPGMELSTRIDQHELHILGYGFDPAHRALLARLEEQRAARQGRIPSIVERLRALGLEITSEDVFKIAGDGAPGRPHVARALVQRGIVATMDEAFKRYLGDGGPGHVQKRVPVPAEAIAWIHAAGGKAVWAHPLARPLQRTGGFEQMLSELKAQGLDGVEEVHPAHTPEQRKRIRKIARQLELKLTGGSDFHGEATPGITIGSGRGHDSVPASVVDALLG
jgi:predicted metal-dependent phosphoesterase TrpH